MKTQYYNLTLNILDECLRERHGGYKYLIESKNKGLLNDGFRYPHTAFRYKENLKEFLRLRELGIGKRIFPNTFSLTGTYSRYLVWSYKEFEEIRKRNPWYFLATENGNKTIGLFLDGIEYVMNSNTDPFLKNSLIQDYAYKGCSPIRKERFHKMWDK